LFWLVSIASYVCKSPSVCFQGFFKGLFSYEVNHEDVVFLHSTL